MGQQQLLLLVLGIVIVGLAVVGGIQAFSENQRKAQLDAHTARAVEVAAEVGVYYHKPAMFGGNERDADMSAPLSLAALGYSPTWARSDGAVSRLDADGTRLQLSTTNSARPFILVHPQPIREGDKRVELAVWGPEPDCFARRVRERTSSGYTTVSGSVSRPSGCSW